MWGVLGLLVVPVAFGVMGWGAFLALFRRGRRRRGVYLFLLAPVFGAFAVFGAMNMDARSDGWRSLSEKSEAEKAGITDPAAFAAVQAQRSAEQKAADDLVAAQKAKVQAVADAEAKRRGFHCLSPWNGQHREFVAAITSVMREPDSFEHVETRVGLVDAAGRNEIAMVYRARNGFGGMNVATATGSFANDGCTVRVDLVE